MKRMFLALAVSTATLIGLPTAAVQASPPDPAASRQCFRTERIAAWTTNKDRAIYVKLQTGAVFLVTLAYKCPGLGLYDTIAFDTDFSSEICGGKPATIITRSGAGRCTAPWGRYAP